MTVSHSDNLEIKLALNIHKLGTSIDLHLNQMYWSPWGQAENVGRHKERRAFPRSNEAGEHLNKIINNGRLDNDGPKHYLQLLGNAPYILVKSCIE
jgi:hypothetical protein